MVSMTGVPDVDAVAHEALLHPVRGGERRHRRRGRARRRGCARPSPLTCGAQPVGWPVATSKENRLSRTKVVVRRGFWTLWNWPPAYITPPTWVSVWTAALATTPSLTACGVFADGTLGHHRLVE